MKNMLYGLIQALIIVGSTASLLHQGNAKNQG